MFTKQLGRIIEVYIDNIVIKSKEADQHLRDIDECFQVLRYYKMRLNLTTCAFGVYSGQFLGHIVTKHGIKANSMQLQSISGLDTPKSIREVQRLTGKIAALSRFISKMSDTCEPFFKSINFFFIGTRAKESLYGIETVSQLTSNSIFTTARRRFVHVFSSVRGSCECSVVS